MLSDGKASDKTQHWSAVPSAPWNDQDQAPWRPKATAAQAAAPREDHESSAATTWYRAWRYDYPRMAAAAALGVHPVHLGILMAVNMEVGLCHPPVGLNLYVASGIAGMGIAELTVAVLPWLLAMLVFLALVTYVPALSLWLPHLLGML